MNVIEWKNNSIVLLDQRRLPASTVEYVCKDVRDVYFAISEMVVRGAPAIGITAAYGVVVSICNHTNQANYRENVQKDIDYLKTSRPTAVNLFWALERMKTRLDSLDSGQDIRSLMLAEAEAIHNEEMQSNLKMSELGSNLIAKGSGVLTHCNTGALATGAYGTALGVIKYGHKHGKIGKIFADETRPWLQGSRLTAWELVQENIPVKLIADGAGAHLMKNGQVHWFIVGADRIMANGDAANKIGTYHAAIAAKYHGVKVMFVAPTSTIDMSLASGEKVEIEERAAEELLSFRGARVAAEGASAWNPVFDVTPHTLIDAIVTEKGVVLAPNTKKMQELMAK